MDDDSISLVSTAGSQKHYPWCERWLTLPMVARGSAARWDDCFPSTRTSTPGPGSDVMSSSKKQNFEVQFRNVRCQILNSFPAFSEQKQTVYRPCVDRGETKAESRNWRVIEEDIPGSQYSYRSTRKARKSSRYPMESFKEREFRNAGIRPPWERRTVDFCYVSDCLDMMLMESTASRSLALMAFTGFFVI